MAAPSEFTPKPGVATSLGAGEGLQVHQQQAAPRTQQADQIRQILGTAGRTAVNVVLTEQRVKDIARRARDRTNAELAQVRQEIARKDAAALSEQEASLKRDRDRTLRDIQREQFRIMRDERSENPEWVLNQAVIRQQNAGDPEYQDAWNQFILQFQDRTRADVRQQEKERARLENEQFRSDANLAKATVDKAMAQMNGLIQTDDGVRSMLIGDGRGISDRVLDYATELAVAAAPYLYDVPDNDPFKAEKEQIGQQLLVNLHAQLHRQTIPNLVQEAINLHHQKDALAGEEEIDAARVGYTRGDMSAREFVETFEQTLDTRFSHLSPAERSQMRLRAIEGTVSEMAELKHLDDPNLAVFRVDQLLQTLDITDAQRNRLVQDVVERKLAPSVHRKFDQHLFEMERPRARKDPNGNTVPGDPRAALLNMLQPNEQGVSQYMEQGVNFLLSMGIDPAADSLSAVQGTVLRTVFDEVAKREHNAAQLQETVDAATEARRRVLQGLGVTPQEVSAAYKNSPFYLAVTGGMDPGSELAHAINEQTMEAGNPSYRFDEDPFTANNKPTTLGLAQNEASIFRENPMVEVPSETAQDLGRMIRSGDMGQMEVASAFWNGLGPRQQAAVAGSDHVGRRERLLMTMVARQMDASPQGLTQEQIASITDTVNSLTDAQISDAAVMASRAAVLNKKDSRDWTEWSEFRDVMNKVWPGSVPHRGRGSGELANMITDTIGDSGDIHAIMTEAYARAAASGVPFKESLEAVAEEMREAGRVMVNTESGVRMMRDPHRHLLHDPAILGQWHDPNSERTLAGKITDGALLGPRLLSAPARRLAHVPREMLDATADMPWWQQPWRPALWMGSLPVRAAGAATDKLFGVDRQPLAQRADESTVGFGMRVIASERYPREQALEFAQRIGLAPDRIEQLPKDNLSMADIVRHRAAQELGTTPAKIAPDDQWEWVPVSWVNPSTERALSVSPQRGGGLPMAVKIPGLDEPFEFLDENHNYAITFSYSKIPTPRREGSIFMDQQIPTAPLASDSRFDRRAELRPLDRQEDREAQHRMRRSAEEAAAARGGPTTGPEGFAAIRPDRQGPTVGGLPIQSLFQDPEP